MPLEIAHRELENGSQGPFEHTDQRCSHKDAVIHIEICEWQDAYVGEITYELMYSLLERCSVKSSRMKKLDDEMMGWSTIIAPMP